MTSKQFVTALGFAFIVTSVTVGFGWALLALVAGSGGFYVIFSVLRGESIEELLDRARHFDPRRPEGPGPMPPPGASRPAGATRPPSAGPRVQ